MTVYQYVFLPYFYGKIRTKNNKNIICIKVLCSSNSPKNKTGETHKTLDEMEQKEKYLWMFLCKIAFPTKYTENTNNLFVCAQKYAKWLCFLFKIFCFLLS